MLERELILLKLKELQPQYKKEGVNILGLFGSYADNNANNNSDIDILYKLDSKEFLIRNDGFRAFSRLREIKEEIGIEFSKKIDLADIDTLNEIGKEYILKQVCYV